MTVTNRVWDPTAVAFVSWRTGEPDAGGIEYPGPDAFGNTSDYTMVRGTRLPPPVDAQRHDMIPNPVGLWQLNGSLVDDINGNDLSWAGTPKYSSAPDGGQAAFTPGEFLSTPIGVANDPIRLTGAMSVEVLVKPSALVTDLGGHLVVFNNLSGGPGTGNAANNFLWGMVLDQSNNELYYYHEDAGLNGYAAFTGVGILPGAWAHVAFTRDSAGTLIRQYVNGTQVASETVGAASASGANSRLGVCAGDGLARSLEANIMSIRVVAQELPASVILADARLTLPPSVRP